MESWVQQSDRAQTHGYAWELMMMDALTESFRAHDFSKWPLQPSIPCLCEEHAGNKKPIGNAVIVGLDEQGLQRGISHEHITMEDFMNSHVNNGSMHDGRAVPPFFFPKAKPSGPDIVFYIQVKDKRFPVFVQLKLRQIMTKSGVKAALNTVSTPMIETHVNDLSSFCPTDNTYISVIIAYPATVVDKLPPRPNHEYNLHPRPEFTQKPLTQVEVIIDKNNIGEIFSRDHIDFLDGIKGPTKRQAEDMQEAECLKKSKKE